MRLNVVLFVIGQTWLFFGLVLWNLLPLACILFGAQMIALAAFREEAPRRKRKPNNAPDR